MFMEEACSLFRKAALWCWLRLNSLVGACLWRICMKPVTSLLTLTPLALVYAVAAADLWKLCQSCVWLLSLKTGMGWRYYQLAVGCGRSHQLRATLEKPLENIRNPASVLTTWERGILSLWWGWSSNKNQDGKIFWKLVFCTTWEGLILSLWWRSQK